MKKARLIFLVMMLSGSIFVGSCDESSSNSEERAMVLLLLLNSGDGSLSFSDVGPTITMSAIGAIAWTGSGWSGTFKKDSINWIQFGLPAGATSGTIYTQADFGSFSFYYSKDDNQYGLIAGHAFSFSITSMAQGRITATFSGELWNGIMDSGVTLNSGTITANIQNVP